MPRFEYQVIPAPKKGEKAKGAKSTAERFAHALTGVMNKMGAEGWEYLRADTLPCDERVGLTGSKTVFQHMLVFRREVADAVPDVSPVPAYLLTDPDPSEILAMDALPNHDIPPKADAD